MRGGEVSMSFSFYGHMLTIICGGLLWFLRDTSALSLGDIADLALSGMLSFPLLIVLTLALIFAGISDLPGVQGALRGMGAVVAGLIAATGLKLIKALKTNVMPTAACAVIAVATFVAVALLRIPLAWVLLTIGSLACGWAYRQLGQLPAFKVRP